MPVFTPKKLSVLAFSFALVGGAGWPAVRSYLPGADVPHTGLTSERMVGSSGIDYGDIRRALAHMARY
jgi:hypothetical protein